MNDGGDSDAEVILRELRTLRRTADDGVTPEAIAPFSVLCKYLGRGDPYLAVGGLRDRLSTAAARGDRDVLALYYSLQPGGDATARIGSAGEKLFVEYRRARDLSDRGCLKLAEQIAADADWQVPFMGVSIDVRSRRAAVQTYVQCIRGYVGYRDPRHLLDGKEIDMESRYVEMGDWERRIYGPLWINVSNGTRTFFMRRIGDSGTRTNMIYTSDNPKIEITSQHAYLTYAAKIKMCVAVEVSGQLSMFES